MKGTVVFVAIDGASGSFDKRYSYCVPPHLQDTANEGCRVTVPFGRGNSKRQGIILQKTEAEIGENLKPISAVTDASPILSRELLSLCEWLHERVFCTYFDAVNVMLPIGLRYELSAFYTVNTEFASASLLSENECEVFEFIGKHESVSQKVLLNTFKGCDEIIASLVLKQAVIKRSEPVRRMRDKTSRFVKLCDGVDISQYSLTDRQAEIVSVVETAGSVSIKELQYFTGVSLSVISALQKKGVFDVFEREEYRTAVVNSGQVNRNEIVLTEDQQKAFTDLKERLNSGETSLLYGVTGSGKTQVFLKLVDEVSDSGKGVIVMVPEIALTPQMINIFSSRYGEKIAVFHSAMSLGRRMDEYKRIKQGKALIAIGTRSAVFAPFENLGLIIIDEEQEHTYKSEQSPKFHARDVARFRAAYHKCLLCLASATPSLESYTCAKRGKYGLETLTKRYGSAVLPEVEVVDMRREILDGNSGAVSKRLAEAISDRLEAKKQIILLLNRRGHNTYITCPSCGWVAQCPNCSVSLTYHSANKRLMCHYCGYSQPVSDKCPDCESEHIRFMGLGTQKLEEELHQLFPSARILRLDADSTLTRDSYSVNLTAFADGEYDIMLGTQMVAKGLDFPNVTLVGVIGADFAMYSDDYRGVERSFSLLTQVVGRAGRASEKGIAIIQTTDPDNAVLSLAVKQDYDAFYETEIMTRKVMIYPPYCDICMIYTQSSDRELALSAIKDIFNNIKNNLENEYKDIKAIILGPCPASVPKVSNKYRFRMIIKCRNTLRFRECIKKAIDIKYKKDTSVSVDINPETVI